MAFEINPLFKVLLSKCKIAIELGKREILIEVPGDLTLEVELHKSDWEKCIKKLLMNLGLSCAKILINGKISNMIGGNYSMNVLSFLSSQEKVIMEELYESPHHKTVVTRTGGKVLICSPQLQTRNFCELDSTQIIGQNAKKVWLPHEWEKREKYLTRDGFVNSFEYEGYRLVEVEKGNPQLHKFVGDFRLVKFYETECILGTFRFA
jgi:hypothetical protein